MRGDREKILERGCDDYISKPFSIREFLALVESYIGETTAEASP
jgi:DNA-binding response OmpR family regulator